jgi:hypothetical protein
MKRLILIALVAFAGWQVYAKYQVRQQVLAAEYADAHVTDPTPLQQSAPLPQTYKCDGRVHCSQMTSCAEATYFLRNCPGTKMDGDNDGIPCEQQWCNG